MPFEESSLQLCLPTMPQSGKNDSRKIRAAFFWIITIQALIGYLCAIIQKTKVVIM
jgi:hypothetical protein